jgi:NitT/TauT family transport system ATP-binding protein
VSETAILFERVHKVFAREGDTRGDFLAVDDLSFSIARGELVAVLGKTGCGKSTMFNLLAGLLEPTKGRVSVLGHDPFREFQWFRGKIGIVFQNDRLLPWRTALANVEYGLELIGVAERERRATAMAWLERLGLQGHEHDYPHALSGGMRQRVSIARAFAVNPDILLCDEPFSALDEITGQNLRKEFLQLVRENRKTSIFITHSINEALQLGQRILVFRRPARLALEGRVRPDMPAEEQEQLRAEILRVLAQDPGAEEATP